MARRAIGSKEIIEHARAVIAAATTVKQMRQAQAVLFPLAYSMSLAETASAIGVSPSWACQLRIKFIRGEMIEADGRSQKGGRRRQNMTLQEERKFIAPFLQVQASGERVKVFEVKAALEQTLGHPVAMASVYNLLHRHHWKAKKVGLQAT